MTVINMVWDKGLGRWRNPYLSELTWLPRGQVSPGEAERDRRRRERDAATRARRAREQSQRTQGRRGGRQRRGGGRSR